MPEVCKKLTALRCSEFNVKGHNFYRKNDYEECGQIADLF